MALATLIVQARLATSKRSATGKTKMPATKASTSTETNASVPHEGALAFGTETICTTGAAAAAIGAPITRPDTSQDKTEKMHRTVEVATIRICKLVSLSQNGQRNCRMGR